MYVIQREQRRLEENGKGSYDQKNKNRQPEKIRTPHGMPHGADLRYAGTAELRKSERGVDRGGKRIPDGSADCGRGRNSSAERGSAVCSSL